MQAFTWRTFTVPMVMTDEAAKAVMRQAEVQRQRDMETLGELLTMPKCKGKGKKKDRS
jgi:hypothetical protein